MGGEVAAAAVGLARLRGTVLTSLHGYIMEVTWSQCRLCTVSPCPHRQQLRHCLWNTRPRVLTTSASNTCTRGWVRRPSGAGAGATLPPHRGHASCSVSALMVAVLVPAWAWCLLTWG